MQNRITLGKEFTRNWITRKEPIAISENPNSPEVRVVDLFCGCGGLTSGIIEASLSSGFKVKIALAIDNNSNAVQIYRCNFKEYLGILEHDNIENIFPFSSSLALTEKELKLRHDIGRVNILTAGPPCQGHSDLNNSTRRKDPRNNLYLSAVQAVKVLSPEFVLIENVPTVIHSKEDVVNRTKEQLNSLNYHCREMKIDFLRLGIPQARKRHVIVASKNERLISSFWIDESKYDKPRLVDYIKDLEKEESNNDFMNSSGRISSTNRERIEFLFNNNLYNLPDIKRPNCHRDKKHSYKSSYGRLNYNLPAQTITSGFGSMGQGRYVHPSRKRMLTLREAARIQGFPDDFSFTKINSITDLRRMIANAVPPQLTFVFAKYYLKTIANT